MKAIYTILILLIPFVGYGQVCPTPQNITISNIESTSVTASWDAQTVPLPPGESVVTSYRMGIALEGGPWQVYNYNILAVETSILVDSYLNLPTLAPDTYYKIRIKSE